MRCNEDCEHCIYPDCVWTGYKPKNSRPKLTEEEKAQREKALAQREKERKALYYQAHKEEIKQRSIARYWRLKESAPVGSREKENARERAYYAKHRDEIAAARHARRVAAKANRTHERTGRNATE